MRTDAGATADIDAGGAITIDAKDDTNATAVAAALSVALTAADGTGTGNLGVSAAVGASVGVNEFGKSDDRNVVKAYIERVDVQGKGGVALSATNENKIQGVAISVSASGARAKNGGTAVALAGTGAGISEYTTLLAAKGEKDSN